MINLCVKNVGVFAELGLGYSFYMLCHDNEKGFKKKKKAMNCSWNFEVDKHGGCTRIYFWKA